MSNGATGKKHAWRIDLVTVAAAVLTFVLTVAAIYESITAGYAKPAPSSDEITTYWVLAALIIAIQLALLVRALILRRRGLLVIALAALAIAIAVVLVSAVPKIDWRAETPTAPHSTHRPCYSGSNSCGPGG